MTDSWNILKSLSKEQLDKSLKLHNIINNISENDEIKSINEEEEQFEKKKI